MNVNTKTTITFKDIFPEEEMKDLNYYLKDIDKETLLKSGIHFSSFSRGSKFEDPKEFLQMYFSKENEEFLKLVVQRLIEFVGKDKLPIKNYSFIYIKSSLSLFEYAFDKVYSHPIPFSNQQLEINLFKAYLILNQKNISERTPILVESTKNTDPLKHFIAFSIALQLNNFELINYDLKKILVTQTLRAISYFDFLETREDCQELLREFYKYYDVKNYQDYIKRVLPLLFSVLTKTKEAKIDIVLNKDAEGAMQAEFLNKFTIQDSRELADFDFRNTRAQPLIRVDETTFRIIYPLFAMELLGNGLYFKLKYINDKLSEDKKQKDLYNLKTFEYSEKYVLNELLKEYFGNRYIQKSGDELENKFPGAPDYYVRNGKKIFLFESKDIMINATIKQSSDFNLINEELYTKLFKNEKNSPKGVLQLINNIKKILSNTLEFDKGFKPKNVIVYPLLIVHHRVFNTMGINKWINMWFKEELQKIQMEGYDTSNVRSIIIIDIDTLIYNKDVIVSKKLNCEKCLNDYDKNYLNFTPVGKNYRSEDELNQAQKNALLPFAEVMDSKIDSENLRGYPHEFREKALTLLAK